MSHIDKYIIAIEKFGIPNHHDSIKGDRCHDVECRLNGINEGVINRLRCHVKIA